MTQLKMRRTCFGAGSTVETRTLRGKNPKFACPLECGQMYYVRRCRNGCVPSCLHCPPASARGRRLLEAQTNNSHSLCLRLDACEGFEGPHQPGSSAWAQPGQPPARPAAHGPRHRHAGSGRLSRSQLACSISAVAPARWPAWSSGTEHSSGLCVGGWLCCWSQQ